MTQRLVALLTTFILVVGHVSSAPAVVAGSFVTKPWKPKIPITLPVPTATGPNAITFANVLEHVPELPTVAWSRVQETIAANAPVSIKTLVYTGPNTEYDITGGSERIKQIIQRTARLWSGFSQVRSVTVISYNYQDLKWSIAKWKSLVKSRKYPPYAIYRSNSFSLNCHKKICNGADAATTDGTGDGSISIGQTGDSSDQFIKVGGVVSHEYSHVVQTSQWLGFNGCDFGGKPCVPQGGWSNQFSACWLNEGLVNSTGNMVAIENLPDFLQWDHDKYYGWGPNTATDYSRPSLFNYLYKSGTVRDCTYPTAQGSDKYTLGYSVGAAAATALIAIAGPQSLMALFAQGASGKPFALAFKSVYGISWKSAAVILSKVLAAEYKAIGPPPF